MDGDAAAALIQRAHKQRKSTDAPSAAPAASGVPPLALALGVLLLIAANFVLTHLLDESGLLVLFAIEAPRPALLANATAAVLFQAAAVAAADRAIADGGGAAMRLELLQRKADGAYAVLQVVRRGVESPAIVPELTGAMELAPARRMRTIFPERAKWRLSSAAAPEGQLPAVGEVSLLVQHSSLRARDEDADAFARAWAEFGYNALGEAGVVRCDLLRDEAVPAAFVARKVFRSAEALAAHEASEHFARWRELVAPLLAEPAGGGAPPELLDTLFPTAAPFPFRSPWV